MKEQIVEKIWRQKGHKKAKKFLSKAIKSHEISKLFFDPPSKDKNLIYFLKKKKKCSYASYQNEHKLYFFQLHIIYSIEFWRSH